jgi:hypothetical protein
MITRGKPIDFCGRGHAIWSLRKEKVRGEPRTSMGGEGEKPPKAKVYSTLASAALSPTMSAPRSLPSVPLFL